MERFFEVDIEDCRLVMSEKELKLHKKRNGGKIDYNVLSEFTEKEIKENKFDLTTKLKTAEQLKSAMHYYRTGSK